MAKIEYVVVDGCIQCGNKLHRKGEVYVPPSAEIRELLLAEGKIVARGKISTSSRVNRVQPSTTQVAAPTGGQPSPSVPDSDAGDDDDDEDDDDDSGD